MEFFAGLACYAERTVDFELWRRRELKAARKRRIRRSRRCVVTFVGGRRSYCEPTAGQTCSPDDVCRKLYFISFSAARRQRLRASRGIKRAMREKNR
jgi:hypothetical protein